VPTQNTHRLTWEEHVLTARNIHDYGGGIIRAVYEAWREYWRKAETTPSGNHIPAAWHQRYGTPHGFGTSVEEALADLLRREHDAKNAPEPAGCRMQGREEEG
jgi:hypothetical protein